MGQWLADAPLVLASQSSARRTLLTAAGVPVDTHPADLDERGLEAAAMAQSAGAVAALLAREKAIAVESRYRGRLTLGADQTLTLGAKRFAKPVDREATASVGAYQIEGLGMQLFERVDGDYFTVLGLPLMEALEFLRRIGCLAR